MADKNLTEAFKVKLVEKYRGQSVGTKVIFDVTPDVIENRTINYKTVEPIHMPGTIQVYTNTSSRTYNISNIKLISRTGEEAAKNLRNINIIRSWGMPYFGESGTKQKKDNSYNKKLDAYNKRYKDYPALRDNPGHREYEGVGADYQYINTMLGAPPNVLYLSAYSDANHNQNIFQIPVVLTQFNVSYPSDVDYIATGTNTFGIKEDTPVATVMSLDMNLVETHAPSQYETFSLQAYKNGTMEEF